MQADRDGSAPVTTTDLVKFAGLAFALVDHVGLFFVEDDAWWRVVGRLAAPIFFFLIGFARSRTVPASWLWLGAGLTALDAWASDEGPSSWSLNILFSFAVLRLALPAVERNVIPHAGRLLALVAALALLIQPLGRVLEYGAEGWLWALFGLTMRLDRELEGQTGSRMRAVGLGLAAAIAYCIVEVGDYEFDRLQASALGVLVVGILAALLAFRREPLPWRPPASVAEPLRFCGRHSLELYAVSLALMQVAGRVAG